MRAVLCLLKPRFAVLLWWAPLVMVAPAAEDSIAVMRGVASAARAGDVVGVSAVAQVHDAKAATLVLDLVGDKRLSFAMREQIAALVAQWPPGPGQDELVTSLQRKPGCSAELVQFYTSLGLPALQPVFLSMLAAQKDAPVDGIKDAPRHAAIVRALERYPDQRDTVVAHLAGLLDEKAPHVLRISAALALGSIRNASSIPALVAQVTDRAIGEDAIGALYRLTGQDHGSEPGAWKTWLEGEGKDAPLQMLTHEDLEKHREEARAAAALDPSNPATFYGLELKGRHIVFVLDVSGSMDGERIDQLRGRTLNLLNLLQSHSKNLRYAILTFSSGVDSCASTRGLMDNDDASFKKATRFVERMQADGATDMIAALDQVDSKLLPANNVDTIYFLSDGEPSDGSPEDVMALVSRIHFEHQVKFHTISITGPKPPPVAPDPASPAPPPPPAELAPPSLLELMAKQTGGEFREL